MKVLLETHNSSLGHALSLPSESEGCRIIGDESNLILVSAASAWEIATKVRL